MNRCAWWIGAGFAIVLLASVSQSTTAAEPARPNILWITSEDHGPHLGCYGDTFAKTPNIDSLAARGLRYRHVWSNAPVCAAARTTLISGMYATSTGGEHMRSMVPFPAGKPMFPQYLREAGYYCTNCAKEDYNLTEPGKTWDASAREAHWKNRAPGQPFFAVFNSNKSHESQIRTRPHQQKHDPAGVRVPAYHPDVPEVREDWAQYYDAVSEADADAGLRLQELEQAGLIEDTIVFYFADHGSGLPRSKRWPYDSGLHIPLVIHIPQKFAHLRPSDYVAGGATDRLVSLVDFAPTMLSLASLQPPSWMQGHAFLGHHAAPAQPYLYGFRGRMDEKIDLVRSVTDGRYVYIRNYLPHRIYGQYLQYMFQTPTTRVWRRLHDEGKLNVAQSAFWRRKPPEELYDLQVDRDEVSNLADSAEHRATLEKLRAVNRDHLLETRDLGFLPEGELFERSQGAAPYDMGHDNTKYPLERILATAELASALRREDTPALIKALEDPDSAVRYWAAQGLLMRDGQGVAAGHGSLVSALADPSPYVRVIAAEGLARFGRPADEALARRVLRDHAASEQGIFVAIAALNSIAQLGDRGAPVRATLRGRKSTPGPHTRYDTYMDRLLRDEE